jgi:hypothetical protein
VSPQRRGRPYALRRRCEDTPALPVRSRTILRTVNPRPIFHPFTQTPSHGIHENVTGLLVGLMIIPQPMIEKISWPSHPMVAGQKLLPVAYRSFQTGLSWYSDNPMQMIRHKQDKPAMPLKTFVIECRSLEYGIARTGAAEVIMTTWLTIDGDEKEASLRHPLRNGMR